MTDPRYAPGNYEFREMLSATRLQQFILWGRRQINKARSPRKPRPKICRQKRWRRRRL